MRGGPAGDRRGAPDRRVRPLGERAARSRRERTAAPRLLGRGGRHAAPAVDAQGIHDGRDPGLPPGHAGDASRGVGAPRAAAGATRVDRRHDARREGAPPGGHPRPQRHHAHRRGCLRHRQRPLHDARSHAPRRRRGRDAAGGGKNSSTSPSSGRLLDMPAIDNILSRATAGAAPSLAPSSPSAPVGGTLARNDLEEASRDLRRHQAPADTATRGSRALGRRHGGRLLARSRT